MAREFIEEFDASRHRPWNFDVSPARMEAYLSKSKLEREKFLDDAAPQMTYKADWEYRQFGQLFEEWVEKHPRFKANPRFKVEPVKEFEEV